MVATHLRAIFSLYTSESSIIKNKKKQIPKIFANKLVAAPHGTVTAYVHETQRQPTHAESDAKRCGSCLKNATITRHEGLKVGIRGLMNTCEDGWGHRAGG